MISKSKFVNPRGKKIGAKMARHWDKLVPGWLVCGLLVRKTRTQVNGEICIMRLAIMATFFRKNHGFIESLETHTLCGADRNDVQPDGLVPWEPKKKHRTPSGDGDRQTNSAVKILVRNTKYLVFTYLYSCSLDPKYVCWTSELHKKNLSGTKNICDP